MRSDYALYTVAIICFILTGITFAFKVAPLELWTAATAILGVLFIGLGYYQRPKPKEPAIEAPSLTPQAPSAAPATPSPTPLTPPTVTEVMEEKKTEPSVDVAPAITELTEVTGIGEIRAGQLKAVGISNVEDLAKASTEDLTAKLKISPKITAKWIENAKKLTEKT